MELEQASKCVHMCNARIRVRIYIYNSRAGESKLSSKGPSAGAGAGTETEQALRHAVNMHRLRGLRSRLDEVNQKAPFAHQGGGVHARHH